MFEEAGTFEISPNTLIHLQQKPAHEQVICHAKLSENKDIGHCQVFALIVGIDEYPDMQRLKGCINDAQSIKTYLKDRFNTPDEHMVSLANEKATRTDILEKFEKHFNNNPSIQKNDLIIFYYAGHGRLEQASASWNPTEGEFWSLVPYNANWKQHNVMGTITNQTFNELVGQLVAKKGNNIIVILDACHAGLEEGSSGKWHEYAPIQSPTGTVSTILLPQSLSITAPLHFDAIDSSMPGSDKYSPMFALIIGISKYLSSRISPLPGCINDVHEMRDYLVNRFPQHNIVILTDDNATRNAIIHAFFRHLIYNQSIKRKDRIIVYYAGHGSRGQAVDGTVGPEVNALVPYDVGEINATIVHSIPVRTINMLLSLLAANKGNNITVIFDSCYSGRVSFGNSASPNGGVDGIPPIPKDIDRKIVELYNRACATPVDFSLGMIHKDMQTHVLLAACAENERAYEIKSKETGKPCGFFTNALLKALRNVGPNRITYQTLIADLPVLEKQHPQCGGANQHRFLWELEFDPECHSHRECTVTRKVNSNANGMVEVDAGSMLGITVGTRFTLEADGSQSSSTYVATFVHLGSSILRPIGPSKNANLAVGKRLIMLEWKNHDTKLKVFLGTNRSWKLVAEDVDIRRNFPRFIRVESLNEAELSVERISAEQFILEWCGQEMSRPCYSMSRTKMRAPFNKLPYALDAIANFTNLLKKGEKRGLETRNRNIKLGLEMYKLTGDFTTCTSNETVKKDSQNKVVEGKVSCQLDINARYGFTICNHSEKDLFAYLLYFDLSNYSIETCYLPVSENMKPPLLAKSSFNAGPTHITIGYGAEGGDGRQFKLSKRATCVKGVLKLYASTNFPDPREIPCAESTGAMRGGHRVRMDGETHNSLVVPITMFEQRVQSVTGALLMQ